MIRVGEEAPDEVLAGKLVEMGYVNQWQAGQLLDGRVKWNLGPYQIVDQIGQGGMGQVFKAEHTIMRRIVAIKVLPLSKSTPDSIASFRREIQAQAQLDHENLVRAYDAGQDGNVHFLVTEYVPGTDLRRLIKRNGRLSMAATAGIICQAAKGLDHAHSRGLIHRDVKPGNLLVTPEGVCKVSDLGLAGFLDEERDARRNKTVGTADYLSPEQIKTPHNLTPSCDIYALGCTAYYAITGKVPFPGGTTRDKAWKHCNEQPLDPRRLNPDVDVDFCDVVADMMVKDPAKRLSNTKDVISRLSRWAGDEWRAAAAGMKTSDSGELRSDAPPPLPLGAFGRPRRGELDDDRQESQGSQITYPVGAAGEETMPWDSQARFAPPADGLPRMVIIAIWMAVSVTLMVIALILFTKIM